MRRIVHYYPDAMANSGVTFALWGWARAQARSGLEVCVLHGPENHSGSHVDFVAKEQEPGLSTRVVPHAGRHRLTLRAVGLRRYLGRDDLLVLHEGWVPSNLVAAAEARRAGVPYVVMPHGVYERAWTQFLKARRIRRCLERHMLERAAAVHVFFESEMTDVTAVAPRASFIAVPTGFDLPDERWTGGGGYLAWVGRIDPIHKGLDALVEAVAQLPEAERPTICIRGYDYKDGVARLRQLIAQHGIERWVRIDGPIGGADKTRFLREAEGYVHPSRWECHSIALLENLALGVPCVVSRSIHIAPTLARSAAAVLVDPQEPELGMALDALTAGRQAIAARGRALVGEAFNWATLVPRFQASLAGLGIA